MAAGLSLAALVVIAATGYWFVTQSGIEPSRWAFSMTQVPDLWAQGFDGTGVTVCIVDTGIDLTHPELGHVNLVAWRDLVNQRGTPYDDEGHGTAMAGIIFARGRLEGVAPEANLIAVKAIGTSGIGPDERIANAVAFCADPNGDGNPADGAHVVSLSLGGGSHPALGSVTETAVNRAMDLGVIVVAAAGNDGQDDNGDVESPASVPRAIAVGAVDRRGRIAAFSSIGNNGGLTRVDPNKKPEVVAPGVEIATLLPGDTYGYVGGTSPAAALTSGIIALLLQAHPGYRHDATRLARLKGAVMDSALPTSAQSVPHDDYYGYGIVQAAATSALL